MTNIESSTPLPQNNKLTKKTNKNNSKTDKDKNNGKIDQSKNLFRSSEEKTNKQKKTTTAKYARYLSTEVQTYMSAYSQTTQCLSQEWM